ncbi:MAG: hypothetical protein ABJF23_26780 [Bryobacteraceae bacterium]
MIQYPSLRTIHLLCGVFAAPALLLYGISAVQMAHNKWFTMKPSVTEIQLPMRPGLTDGRQMAQEVMGGRGIRGDITSVRKTPAGLEARVTVPGTVHEIRYESVTGQVAVKTSVAGFMGMLNRLHHAAGLSHEYVPLRLWGVLAALVSLAILGLGATGIWMWWLRKQERRWGLILLTANLMYALTLLVMMRAAGP